MFYHYTTRLAAQEISIAGMIAPGRSGAIYVTDVLYRIGWQATDRLALPQRSAEVVFVVPYHDLPRTDDGRVGVEYVGIVGPWLEDIGRSYRRGGGHEWVVRRPIPLRSGTGSWFSLEVP